MLGSMNVHTALCGEDHESPSLGLDDKLGGLFPSLNLNVEPKPKLLSVSEPHESRAPRPISSLKPPSMRSVLGLPELTNDISLSGGGRSPYDLFEFFPLVNGDLHMFVTVNKAYIDYYDKDTCLFVSYNLHLMKKLFMLFVKLTFTLIEYIMS